MREIKFRAWIKEEKKMLPVQNLDFLCEYADVRESYNLYLWDFKEIELMQFTGLQDEKGIDIYEGDILSLPNKDIAVVIWSPPRFILQRYRRIYQDLRLEHWSKYNKIIGNIYENPELLEVK